MKTTIISGNFKVELDGEIDGNLSIGEGDKAVSAAQAIEEAGITYIVQRDGLSKVYKGLLAKGAKRDSLDFSDDAATKFGEALEKALAPYGTFAASVSEHVPSEGGGESPMVRATTFVDQLIGTPQEAGLRAILGVSEDDSRETMIKAAHERRLGVSAPRKAKEQAAS